MTRASMNQTALRAIFCFALLALVACGSTTSDRAISGGAIGAGAGVVGGLVFGLPVAGALAGAAVGAGAGALTDEDQINLGEPIWR